jgi:2-phosphosulfolactate phosphatase
MTRAKIAFTADSLSAQDARGTVCVVIDVLRASTTIVAALANGCPSVIPVETPEQAREIARKRGCLLGGERNGLKVEGFDFGNSPLEYVSEKIDGRSIAFTTTNGTRAIRACAASDALFVASFLNGKEVVRLLEKQKKDILIVCAGTRGKPSIEDTVCGGMLLEALHVRGGVEADEAVSLWKAHRENLAAMMKNVSEHGRSLMELGFERDIDFATRVDEYGLIAVREGDSIVRKTP